MRFRRLSIVAAVLVLLSVGCSPSDGGSESLSTVPPTSNPPGDQTGPAPGPNAISYTTGSPTAETTKIDFARTGFNDQQLIVSFVAGPPAAPNDDQNWCAADYTANVESLPDRVVVQVHGLDRGITRPPNSGCAAVGYVRLLAVTLPDPLNGRPVFDRSRAPDADQSRPVVDGRPFAVPRYLPEGWTLQSEEFSERFWGQTFAIGPAQPWQEQGPNPRPTVNTVQMSLPDGDDPISSLATTGYLGQGGFSEVVATPTVHGLSAELRVQDDNRGRTSFVLWQEAGYWFGVSAVPGTDIFASELMQIAESMQPYTR